MLDANVIAKLFNLSVSKLRAIVTPDLHNTWLKFILNLLDKSLDGNLYCLVIADDYSRYTCTFFLEDKSKTMGIFKIFVKQAQNEFESSVVKVQSDNGTEFRNT